jgi:hypothetical protein
MLTISKAEKERIQAECDKAVTMGVYAVRMAADNGNFFVVAASKIKARKTLEKSGRSNDVIMDTLRKATPNEVSVIAVRALLND